METHEHEFAEVQGAASSPERLNIDDLRDVRLTLTADLGEAHMLVREILELREGVVVPLNKIAGEMTDIYVNGVPLAKGEVVVIADSVHVRFEEIVGISESDKDTGSDEE